MSNNNEILSSIELARIIDAAAEAGAKRALESVGLHDGEAGKDIRDLRDLIDSWRQVRGAALQAIGKLVVMILLGALVFFTGKHISLS